MCVRSHNGSAKSASWGSSPGMGGAVRSGGSLSACGSSRRRRVRSREGMMCEKSASGGSSSIVSSSRGRPQNNRAGSSRAGLSAVLLLLISCLARFSTGLKLTLSPLQQRRMPYRATPSSARTTTSTRGNRSGRRAATADALSSMWFSSASLTSSPSLSPSLRSSPWSILGALSRGRKSTTTTEEATAASPRRRRILSTLFSTAKLAGRGEATVTPTEKQAPIKVSKADFQHLHHLAPQHGGKGKQQPQLVVPSPPNGGFPSEHSTSTALDTKLDSRRVTGMEGGKEVKGPSSQQGKASPHSPGTQQKALVLHENKGKEEKDDDGEGDEDMEEAKEMASIEKSREARESKGTFARFRRRWGLRGKAVVRTFQVWFFLFRAVFMLAKQRLVSRDPAKLSLEKRKLGRYLCKALLKLGPTFIKLGQLLSTRIDLLSKEYIEELSELQDNVKGFGGKRAKAVIKVELGAPVSELFDTFDETPLAAASLGQVHLATLDGKTYAVKVQRPGLKDLFEVDLKSMAVFAKLADMFDPKIDGTSRDWTSILKENKRVLYEEVDYRGEGRNAARFAKSFENCDWIKVPEIRWDRSSSKILCMEYVQGIKISDYEKIDEAGIDRKKMATRIAECYLVQLIENGFFHCDPHPGNLACDVQGDNERLIFYDFGMMDELSPELKRNFVDLIFGIYENDPKEVVDAMEDMDIIRQGSDRMTVERVARFYLDTFQSTLQSGGKWINQMDEEEEKMLRRSERAKIGQDLFTAKSDIPIKFPPSFTFVFRAFTTLDGIGKGLDSEYDLTRIANPYLKKLLDVKDGSVYKTFFKSLQRKAGLRPQDLASVVKSPRRVAHIDDVTERLERGDLKLRVRVLESEQAFGRIEAIQYSLSAALMCSLFLNGGFMALSVASPLVPRLLFSVAGFFGFQIPIGYVKVWQMKRRDKTKGFR